MPSGTVNHSGPLPKPRAVKAKSSPVAIGEAGGLQEQHLQHQPADDPEHRPEPVGLALGQAVAEGREARGRPRAAARKPDIT